MKINLYPGQTELPKVVKTETVRVLDRGVSVVAGTLHTLSDGTFFSVSDHERSPVVRAEGGMRLQTYGSAKWYLELCAAVRGLAV